MIIILATNQWSTSFSLSKMVKHIEDLWGLKQAVSACLIRDVKNAHLNKAVRGIADGNKGSADFAQRICHGKGRSGQSKKD